MKILSGPKWNSNNQDHQKNATPVSVYMGPLKILNLQEIAQRGLSFIEDVRNHVRFRAAKYTKICSDSCKL